ncbi:unnamed protein product [Callosobruchus maculatus]|uniref:Uncharacterized protein n=1 Tax=Callosobruchus maculatus TaxID=64391 RepID=A0A653C679_CALMS|nr:unnamed protein product [Callosobruchus maculatus]
MPFICAILTGYAESDQRGLRVCKCGAGQILSPLNTTTPCRPNAHRTSVFISIPRRSHTCIKIKRTRSKEIYKMVVIYWVYVKYLAFAILALSLPVIALIALKIIQKFTAGRSRSLVCLKGKTVIESDMKLH